MSGSVKAAVIYYSATGSVWTMAKAVAEGAEKAGAEVRVLNDGVEIKRNGARLNAVEVTTEAFPGFATDLQAQFMALMTRSSGVSHVTETIFENRFMHVQEMNRLGACIGIEGHTAIIEGVQQLVGAPVMATDLRASASLVIAGLAARGETLVDRIYHLDRGYDRMEVKLRAVGADIQRVN